MPRLDGDVFLFGTAMILSIVPPLGSAGLEGSATVTTTDQSREAMAIHGRSRAG